MRRILAIALILALFAPLALLFSSLQWKKHQVRREVKHLILRSLDRKQLTLIRVHRKDAADLLDWKHENEFEFNEKMYDLVSKEHKGDTLYLWTWEDSLETSLEQDLEALLGLILQSNESKNRGQECVLQFFKATYMITRTEEFPPAPEYHWQYAAQSIDTINRSSDPLVPPPQVS